MSFITLCTTPGREREEITPAFSHTTDHGRDEYLYVFCPFLKIGTQSLSAPHRTTLNSLEMLILCLAFDSPLPEASDTWLMLLKARLRVLNLVGPLVSRF